MNWHHFAFANPAALWLLALLPLLALLRSARGAAPAIKYSSLEPFRAAGSPRKSRAGGFLFGLFLSSLALFISGLARPQTSETLSRSQASGIDIMLALDVSRSMLAEDITIGSDRANRIEAVKKITADFIEGRPNDRIGMIAFAGNPYLVSPLTLDHDWLLKNLERVRIGLVEDGTAIGTALASCANRLKDRADSKSRIIVLLTDGGNNAGKVDPPTAAEAARALGIKIYTIGVGSQGKARIPVQDQFGRTIYAMIDCDVDEPGLKQLAKIGNGEFYRATNAKALEEIFHQIDQLEKSTIEVSEKKKVHDLFPWFLVAGIILLGLNIVFDLTVWKRIP
jgi:Ca-activated chloride channel family protein